ncbi:MAG: tRNA (guanine(46)-N(7))-methyltransferase TrmB [Pseudomonadota bacterium]
MTHETDDTPAAPNGAPWRNFYGRRHGKRMSGRQKDLLETRLAALSPGAVTRAENPERNPLELAGLCGGRDRLWLEIGFGGGEHMIAQAEANPEATLIGCEPFVNGVAKLLAAIDSAHGGSGLPNLCLHAGDARDVMEVMPAASVDRVFLLYPDPWPKRRHHKRRFVNAENLDQLARLMAPGAHLRVATDIEDYVRHTLVETRRDGRFRWLAERAADWRTPWPDWPGTRYEAKALREGRRPHYLTFARI